MLLALLIWSVVALIRQPGAHALFDLLLVTLVGIVGYFERAFAAANQDRIIRLEERLRLERLLPGDLKARVADFTAEQLVGLRFASDAELPALARRVLEENVRSRGAIKKLVTTWRPDEQRI